MTNLDDLMAAWQSQDADPLHGVNEPLLGETLRREQMSMRRIRRVMTGAVVLISSFFLAVLVVFLAIMIDPADDDVLAGWEYAIPVVGAAAALLVGGVAYRRHRALARLERRFGESLRDQLRLHIAQLDYKAARDLHLVSLLVVGLLVCSAAMTLASRVVNDKPLGVDWAWLVRKMTWFAILWVGGVWLTRLSVQRELLPRRRRLEALLGEIDGQ